MLTMSTSLCQGVWPQPKVIWDLNPYFRIDPNSDLDFCRSLPECCGFISLSASVISSCHENRPVTVWGTLINLLKSPIPQWWWKWKSDPESAPRTESPPKVNKLFQLVEPIITPSFCTQSDCQTNSNHCITSTLVEATTNMMTTNHQPVFVQRA